MVWVVSAPLVFARSRSDVAAFAHDYVTLVGIELDRAGHYEDYLLPYRWSTVDRRMSALPAAGDGKLRILAEGRSLDLTALDAEPESLTRLPELHAPPVADRVMYANRVDPGILRFLATSRAPSVQLLPDSLATPLVLWKDGRAALRELAARASLAAQ